MKIPKHAISKTVGILVILFTSFGAIAEERKSYDALEFGQFANKFTDVFEGPTLRTVSVFLTYGSKVECGGFIECY